MKLNFKQFTEKKLLIFTIFYTLTLFKMSFRGAKRDAVPFFPL